MSIKHKITAIRAGLAVVAVANVVSAVFFMTLATGKITMRGEGE